MDWGLVVAILVFVECLLILRGLLELSRQIDEGLEELDGNLATAIQNTVENIGNFSGIEPPSPIQNALAQILMNSVNPDPPGASATILEAVRDDGGKFLKKE